MFASRTSTTFNLTRISRHWVSGWRFFEGKHLPPRDDGSSQKQVFSKCCSVMRALVGIQPETHQCEQDPEFWFNFLWTRLCNRFGWSADVMWSVSTCYDKLNDQKPKRTEACQATTLPTASQRASQATSTAAAGLRSANVALQEAAAEPASFSAAAPAIELGALAQRAQIPIFDGEVVCIRCCFCAAYLSVSYSNDRRRNENTNMLQHMRQKHQNDALWMNFQRIMGTKWHCTDVLKLWVRICPRVPCCKSQPAGHFVYKPRMPQIATTFGAVNDYCGDLFRDVPNGNGVRVLPTSAFMGMFQAGTEVLGVHYDQRTDTLFAGSMVHGQRHLASGSMYAASERNSIARDTQ